VLHDSFLQLLIEHGDFLNMDISQGIVATSLRRSGMFKYNFITNLLLSLAMKNFFENRLIFGEITDKSVVSCFLTHGVEPRIVLYFARQLAF